MSERATTNEWDAVDLLCDVTYEDKQSFLGINIICSFLCLFVECFIFVYVMCETCYLVPRRKQPISKVLRTLLQLYHVSVLTYLSSNLAPYLDVLINKRDLSTQLVCYEDIYSVILASAFFILFIVFWNVRLQVVFSSSIHKVTKFEHLLVQTMTLLGAFVAELLLILSLYNSVTAKDKNDVFCLIELKKSAQAIDIPITTFKNPFYVCESSEKSRLYASILAASFIPLLNLIISYQYIRKMYSIFNAIASHQQRPQIIENKFNLNQKNTKRNKIIDKEREGTNIESNTNTNANNTDTENTDNENEDKINTDNNLTYLNDTQSNQTNNNNNDNNIETTTPNNTNNTNNTNNNDANDINKFKESPSNEMAQTGADTINTLHLMPENAADFDLIGIDQIPNDSGQIDSSTQKSYKNTSISDLEQGSVTLDTVHSLPTRLENMGNKGDSDTNTIKNRTGSADDASVANVQRNKRRTAKKRYKTNSSRPRLSDVGEERHSNSMSRSRSKSSISSQKRGGALRLERSQSFSKRMSEVTDIAAKVVAMKNFQESQRKYIYRNGFIAVLSTFSTLIALVAFIIESDFVILLYFDAVLNGILMISVFQFGEWIFDSLFVKFCCKCCCKCCYNCCCKWHIYTPPKQEMPKARIVTQGVQLTVPR